MDQSIVSDYVMSQRVRKDLRKLTIARAPEKEKENVCLPAKAREKERAVARTKTHNLQTDLCQKNFAPRKGGKGKSKSKGVQQKKGKGKGKKGSGKDSWLGSSRGRWQ